MQMLRNAHSSQLIAQLSVIVVVLLALSAKEANETRIFLGSLHHCTNSPTQIEKRRNEEDSLLKAETNPK